MKQRRGLFVVFILASVLALAGCSASGDEAAPSIASSTPYPEPSMATGTPKASASGSSIPLNDFRTGRKEKVFKVRDLTVNVEYSTPIRWTSSARKPLNVTLTAFVPHERGRKIYLSQVTVDATPSDASGPLASTDSSKDGAAISPGYLVTFPETYNQSFLLPELDDAATSLDIDLKYEFLLLKGCSTSRDYAKRTAMDSLTVALRNA